MKYDANIRAAAGLLEALIELNQWALEDQPSPYPEGMFGIVRMAINDAMKCEAIMGAFYDDERNTL